MSKRYASVLVLLAMAASSLEASIGRLTREAVKLLLRKGVQESAEVLTKKVGKLVTQYGDDAAKAILRGGPGALHCLEKAAASEGPALARMIARHGEKALPVLGKSAGKNLALRYGDDALQAMMRHSGIAEPLIGKYGKAMAKCLPRISPRNARRLEMLRRDGTFDAITHLDRFLEVVFRYSDRAVDFVWRNKEKVFAAAILIRFLSDPEPYLEGRRELETAEAP